MPNDMPFTFRLETSIAVNLAIEYGRGHLSIQDASMGEELIPYLLPKIL